MFRILLLLVALFVATTVQSQNQDSLINMMSDPHASFFDVMHTVDSVIDDSTVVLDSAFLKRVDRYKAFYSNRVGPDGTIYSFASVLTSQLSTLCLANPVVTEPWEAMGPFTVTGSGYGRGIGRLTSVAVDKANNMVYAGSESGGLWKRNLGSPNWINVTESEKFPALGIQDIALNPNDPNEIYIATAIGGYDEFSYGLGVLRSRDGGQSWSTLNIGPNNYTYKTEALAVKFAEFDSSIVLAGVGSRLYKKNAGTNSWTEIFKIEDYISDSQASRSLIRDIEIISDQGSTKVYLSTACVTHCPSGYVFRGDLSGNWTDITPSPPIDKWDRGAISILNSNPTEIFFLGGDYPYGAQVYRSTDRGNTWVLVKEDTGISSNGLGADKFRCEINISPTNPDRVYIAGYRLNTIELQPNGTWSYSKFSYWYSNYHVDVRGVYIIANGSHDEVWIVHDGGICRTDDALNVYYDLSNGMNCSEFYDVAICESQNNTLAAGAIDNGTIMVSGDTEHRRGGGDGSPALFLKSDPNELFYSLNGVIKSYNIKSGSSGTTNIPKDGTRFGLNLPLVQHPVFPDKIIAGRKRLYVWDYPTNTNTAESNLSSFNNNWIKAIAMSYQNENKIYVAVDDYDGKHVLYKKDPSTSTWINISNDFRINGNSIFNKWKSKVTDLIVDQSDDNRLFASMSGVDGLKLGGSSTPVKVVMSNDGGNNWTDFSDGLPNVPVNRLFELGSFPSGYLFAATDVGVFVRNLNPSASDFATWECLSNGLPPCIVMNFDYSPCSQELAIATYGRGMWKMDISYFVNEESYNVSGNEIWNTDRSMSGDIIIEPGATLTIENCTISMAKGARILVASNQGGSSGAGKLIVNNATLTNNCGQHWSGIDVAGDSYRGNMSHQYTYQGLSHVGIAIINNSIIEHAEIAIENWSNGNWSSFGGRIHAENTIFRNNRRAVGFGSYKNHAYWDANKVMPYMSSFAKCTFTIDDNFREEVDPHMGFHVTMWDVQGISFLGCSFKYDVANYRQAKELSGVYSIDATYNIFPYEYSLVGGVKIESLFENLHYGVHAMGGGNNTGNLIVEECLFKNNEYGIGLHGVSNAVLVKNKIRHSASLWNHFYGIWARQSDPFTIEQNTFRDDDGGVFRLNTFGIIIDDCGPSNNIVYKNAFANTLNPLIFLKDNVDPAIITSGVQFNCNVLDSNNSGHAVRILGGTGIAQNQGATGNPADNTFDFNADGYFKRDIDNNGTNGIMTYYHSPDAAGFKLEPVYLRQVNAQRSSVAFDSTNNCISNIRDQLQYSIQWNSGYYNALRMELAQSEADYTQSNYLYQSLVDGGETEELIADVQTSNTWDAWNLRNELIASSPLSTDVLMELIEKNTLSNALLFDVLMQNPHASRHEEIIHLLQTKPNPFPAYMMTLLAGMEDNYSQKDLLEAEMSRARADQYKDLRLLSMHYFADTIVGPDSLWSLWSGFDDPKGELQKVLLKRAEGQKTLAQQTFDQIPTKYQLTESMQHQWNSLDDYYAHYDQLMATNREGILNEETVRSTFSSELNDTRTLGGRYARNWEKFALGETYTLELPIPGSGSGKRAAEPEKEEGVLDMRNLIKVYPNPAREYVNIEVRDELREAVLDVQIISTTGQVVRHLNGRAGYGFWTISLEGLSSGVYSVQVMNGDKLILSERLELL
jgi:hypothetical protein